MTTAKIKRKNHDGSARRHSNFQIGNHSAQRITKSVLGVTNALPQSNSSPDVFFPAHREKQSNVRRSSDAVSPSIIVWLHAVYVVYAIGPHMFYSTNKIAQFGSAKSISFLFLLCACVNTSTWLYVQSVERNDMITSWMVEPQSRNRLGPAGPPKISMGCWHGWRNSIDPPNQQANLF